MNAFGGINITGGAQTQALTTTAGQLVAFSQTGGANSDAQSPGPDVQGDSANNRIKVLTPGNYFVNLVIEGTMSTGSDLIAQIYKNGVAVAHLKSKSRITTNKGQLVLAGILSILVADNPANLKTFADPASTEFTGAGAAPQNLCPVTVDLSVAASTDTLTIEEVQFSIFRLDG